MESVKVITRSIIHRMNGIIRAIDVSITSRQLENKVPVVHAHWVETGTGDCIECSKCGYEPSADVKESEEWDDEIIGDICPPCGAKMDESVDE